MGRGDFMFDDIERLRESQALLALLSHYAQPAILDRNTWQERLIVVDGLKALELTALHGELLAHGWLEVNLGCAETLKPGTVPCCYRISLAGLRALRRAQQPREEEDEIAQAA